MEIESGDVGHGRRRRKIDDGFGSFGRRDREKLRDPSDGRKQAASFVAKARRDKPRMQTIRGYARPAQSPRKLASEQNITELRTTVGSDRSKVLG